MDSAYKIFFLCFATILVGCASIRQYPTDWPAVAKRDCQDVSGIYKNNGENFPDWDIDLRGLLSSRANKNNTIYAVSLKWEHGQLDVDFIENSQLDDGTTITFKQDQVECMDGNVVISLSKSVEGADSSVGISLFSSEILYLNLADDKSLVIKREISEIGLAMFIIPIYITETQWHRFVRL